MLKNFLESRLDKWKRLEDLTARASRFRLRTLSGEEVREFGRLYRRTAADLAIAREEVRDQRLVNYLNHLVGRAHGAIYRSEASGFGVIGDFLRYEFPALFRQCFAYIFAAFSLFVLSAAFAWGAVMVNEDFADRVSPKLREDISEHRNWTESLNQANPLGSTKIQTNNIMVTFFAFAGGVLAGLGTVWVMINNGIEFGLFWGLCIRHRFWDVPIFVASHGVIELTAIFIAGGAGLMIGQALLMPGDLRRIDALVVNGQRAIKLILGCVPMLLIAGTIEGFISPSHIPAYLKFTLSGMTAIALVFYFLKPDLRKEAAENKLAIADAGK